jgi:hypothetical protein
LAGRQRTTAAATLRSYYGPLIGFESQPSEPGGVESGEAMRMHVTLAAASVGLAAIALTGCSGGSKPATTNTSSAGTAASAGTVPAPGTSSASSGSGSSAGLDACSLLTVAKAAALVGKQYTSDAAQTIAPGQDQCTYNASGDDSALVVIVYQSNSGVTFASLKSVQAGAGQVTNVSGVGQTAIAGPIELDAQVGDQLLAVQGAGGTLTGNTAKATAVADAIISALH